MSTSATNAPSTPVIQDSSFHIRSRPIIADTRRMFTSRTYSGGQMPGAERTRRVRRSRGGRAETPAGQRDAPPGIGGRGHTASSYSAQRETPLPARRTTGTASKAALNRRVGEKRAPGDRLSVWGINVGRHSPQPGGGAKGPSAKNQYSRSELHRPPGANVSMNSPARVMSAPSFRRFAHHSTAVLCPTETGVP